MEIILLYKYKLLYKKTKNLCVCVFHFCSASKKKIKNKVKTSLKNCKIKCFTHDEKSKIAGKKRFSKRPKLAKLKK